MKSKKLMPVIIFAIVIIAVFNIYKTEAKPLAITESFTQPSIFVEDTGINIDIAKKYESDYEFMPEEFKPLVTSITITNKNLGEMFGLNVNAKIMAITCGTDIYINDANYDKNVLIHEMFHAYDYSNNWITKTREFQDIYVQEKNFVKVSDGNTQNAQEFFASAGQIYFYSPETLKEIAPLTYEFFTNHLGF